MERVLSFPIKLVTYATISPERNMYTVIISLTNDKNILYISYWNAKQSLYHAAVLLVKSTTASNCQCCTRLKFVTDLKPF